MNEQSFQERLRQRFWGKVHKGSGCWEWGAKIDIGGYGKFSVRDKEVMAHRFAYEEAVGAIPDGLQLDHLCRNRKCVNPLHLEAVTPRVNVLRSDSLQARNAVKTHCVRGHPLSGDNLRHDPSGWRQCAACIAIRKRRYRCSRVRQEILP